MMPRGLVRLGLTALLAVTAAGRGEAQTGPWIAVLSTPDSATYVDSASIRTIKPDLIELWSKRTFTIAIRDRAGIFDIEMTKWRIRCAARIGMSLESALYKGDELVDRNTSGASRQSWTSPGWMVSLDAVIAKGCLLARP